MRVDDTVEEALLTVVQPAATEAALAAEAQAFAQRDQVREALLRDLEAARYAADRAFRQYDGADPENRLVAGELEARWNRALTRVAEVEKRIADHDAGTPRRLDVEPVSFATLAQDLKSVWTAPTTDARLKKRIVRTVIREVIADLDDETAEIVVIIHWMGGAHTEHRLPRRRRGQRNSTSAEIVEAVSKLALIAKDDVIAGILNRNCLKTGNGNRWTRERVTSLRSTRRERCRALAQPQSRGRACGRRATDAPDRGRARRNPCAASSRGRSLDFQPHQSRRIGRQRPRYTCPGQTETRHGIEPEPTEPFPINNIGRCAL